MVLCPQNELDKDPQEVWAARSNQFRIGEARARIRGNPIVLARVMK